MLGMLTVVLLYLHVQVYAWGVNAYGQLGHSESGTSPSRIKVCVCSLRSLKSGISQCVLVNNLK